jgi:alcohol dehydrogenase class IV
MEDIMPFEFASPNRIIFGPGTISQIPGLAAPLGTRACLITGRNPERAQPLLDGLKKQGIESCVFSVSGEPTVAVVEEGVALARLNECDLVISFGGGSVLDTGKALAALLTNPGELKKYLEVIGDAQPITQTPAPHHRRHRRRGHP